MRWIRTALACSLLSAVPHGAWATTYEVGPGKPHATPGEVPWEALAPGDSVLIYGRGEPYRDKWVICRAGTATSPIVVRGIPDATAGVPVIDGAGAATRAALNYWNENRGVLKIGGANHPPDTMPAWIVIEGLDIRGGRPENTFTGRNGLTSYAGNAAAIYVEKGQHIVVRGCRLHDCSNGFFCADQTSDLLLEGNRIDDNGNVGSIYEHNNYTEALGIVFQLNWFGPLRAGAGGNNLKDRSAGTVIRYNWIEGGNRQLDLVESDAAALRDDPSYRSTFVYGNVLFETGDDGNSQIAHYGGDGAQTATYRKGTLYFHHNTVVSKRTGNTTLLRLSSSGEAADARDNIIQVTAAGNRLALLDQSGTLTATRNWMKTGWVASHSGGGANVIDAGQVTGADPGFADLAGADFALIPASPCVDQAVGLLPACLPEHAPTLEYVKHQASRPRPDDGAPDLGAYEYAPPVGVPGITPGAAPARLWATPNPFSSHCEIRLTGAGPAHGQPAALEVLDVRGRAVVRLPCLAPGRWSWTPPAGLPQGIYFLRSGSLTRRVAFAR